MKQIEITDWIEREISHVCLMYKGVTGTTLDREKSFQQVEGRGEEANRWFGQYYILIHLLEQIYD